MYYPQCDHYKYLTLVYLYHKALLSIQRHIPDHTDQSRGYRQSCLYSVRNSFVYSLDRTSHQCILGVKKKIAKTLNSYWNFFNKNRGRYVTSRSINNQQIFFSDIIDACRFGLAYLTL